MGHVVLRGEGVEKPASDEYVRQWRSRRESAGGIVGVRRWVTKLTLTGNSGLTTASIESCQTEKGRGCNATPLQKPPRAGKRGLGAGRKTTTTYTSRRPKD